MLPNRTHRPATRLVAGMRAASATATASTRTHKNDTGWATLSKMLDARNNVEV
jgi:hypothetical protein